MNRLLVVAATVMLPLSAAHFARETTAVGRSALLAPARADSVSELVALRKAAELFITLSKKAWLQSELDRGTDRPGSTDQRRLVNAHCHLDGSNTSGARVTNSRERYSAPPSIVTSAFSRFSICPDWRISNQGIGVDETTRPDAGLNIKVYQKIVDARLALIAKLDSAAVLYPADEWIAGQRMRFREDAGQANAALAVANDCRASELLCTKLRGFAHYNLGHPALADSFFLHAVSLLPDSVRCDWISIEALLPKPDRPKYHALSCAARDSIDRALWWLADPMYIEPGNERRAEHFARVVHIELIAALPETERWNLRDEMGGDAVRYMLLRYGWPTKSFYGGSGVDYGHNSWLAQYMVPPYSAPEYSRDRIATLPNWEAILDPITVQDSDFTLTEPPDIEPTMWWPSEHFRRAQGTITILAEGQSALLRRDNSVLFALATRLTSRELSERKGRRARASLVVSPRPDSAFTVNTQVAYIGQTTLLQGPIPSGTAIAGVEIGGQGLERLSARSRFGIVAPPTLREMRAGTVAVSDPVLFEPAALDAASQSEMSNILDVMHPSTRLESPTQIGVYWESYGFRQGDTVDVSVQIERVNQLSKARRIGMAFRVTTDPNFTVAARWTEPQPGRASQSIPGMMPILARHITQNIGQLPAGTYRLRVAMRRKGGEPVSADRLFQLTR